jgi:S1-C subfamily serine protease
VLFSITVFTLWAVLPLVAARRAAAPAARPRRRGGPPPAGAGRAGPRPGQVIVTANGREIGSVDELVEAARAARNGAMSLVVDDPQVGRVIISYELQT